MSGPLTRFLLRPAEDQEHATPAAGPVEVEHPSGTPPSSGARPVAPEARRDATDAPPATTDGPPTPDAPTAGSALVVVLGGGEPGRLAARAAAQLLRRQHGRPAVLLCRWTGRPAGDDRRSDAEASGVAAPQDGPPSQAGLAVPAASRLVVAARAVHVAAVARGRLAEVDLDPDEGLALAAVERLEPLGAPVVVHLVGPWGPRTFALLAQAGDVVVHGSAAAVAASRATLDAHGIGSRGLQPPRSPLARARLRAGWSASGTELGEEGQAGVGLLVLLGTLAAVAVALGSVAAVAAAREERQRAVDVAALAGAADLRRGWGATAAAGRGTAPLVARARSVAERTAASNGLRDVRVDFPDRGTKGDPPLRVRVRGGEPRRVAGVAFAAHVAATAEMTPAAPPSDVTGDAYDGPLATRLGQRMRPDVALAFDRLQRAATRDGHRLTITSGFRSDAEQAELFAAHPDPKWVARPGTSLHRMGTELDLGPPSAYGWLAAHADEHGFKKRYSWEPWHFGFVREPRSTPNDVRKGERGALQSWVPARYAPAIRRASVRWKVSAALLAAQLKAESNFDPGARSGAGAVGIAQFMPATAAAYGLRNPFDAEASIDAQGRMMSGLLRQFGSVPLALAAYNAGPGNVQRYGGVPPFDETRHYVARILALMRGHDIDSGLLDAMPIRLVA